MPSEASMQQRQLQPVSAAAAAASVCVSI